MIKRDPLIFWITVSFPELSARRTNASIDRAVGATTTSTTPADKLINCLSARVVCCFINEEQIKLYELFLAVTSTHVWRRPWYSFSSSVKM